MMAQLFTNTIPTPIHSKKLPLSCSKGACCHCYFLCTLLLASHKGEALLKARDRERHTVPPGAPRGAAPAREGLAVWQEYKTCAEQQQLEAPPNMHQLLFLSKLAEQCAQASLGTVKRKNLSEQAGTDSRVKNNFCSAPCST